jgi:hypothetical protein
MIQKFKSALIVKKVIENNFKVQKRLASLTSEQKIFVSTLFDGLISNKRADLAKAITLIETTNPIKKLQGL